MVRRIVLTALTLVLFGCATFYAPAFAENVQAAKAKVVNSIDKKEEFFAQLVDLAKKGKTINCEFPLGSKIDDIEKKWGKANDYADSPYKLAAMYDKKKIIFNQHSLLGVVEITSKDPDITKLNLKDVRKYMGQPFKEITFGDALYLYYPSNEDFAFEAPFMVFTFMLPTKKQPNPSIYDYELTLSVGSLMERQ